jgi:hypothetical protein
MDRTSSWASPAPGTGPQDTARFSGNFDEVLLEEHLSVITQLPGLIDHFPAVTVPETDHQQEADTGIVTPGLSGFDNDSSSAHSLVNFQNMSQAAEMQVPANEIDLDLCFADLASDSTPLPLIAAGPVSTSLTPIQVASLGPVLPPQESRVSGILSHKSTLLIMHYLHVVMPAQFGLGLNSGERGSKDMHWLLYLIFSSRKVLDMTLVLAESHQSLDSQSETSAGLLVSVNRNEKRQFQEILKACPSVTVTQLILDRNLQMTQTVAACTCLLHIIYFEVSVGSDF